MQGVTAIHSRMSGDYKQFCSLVWVHLDLLVVFFTSLSDVNSEIHDLAIMKEVELIYLAEQHGDLFKSQPSQSTHSWNMHCKI